MSTRLKSFAISAFLTVLSTVFYTPLCASGQGPEPPTIRARYLSPEQVVEGSNVVVFGTIREIETERQGKRVYTHAKVEVKEVWQGDISQAFITVKQPGGRAGELVSWAGPMPNWETGDNWVFGLNRVPHGWLTIHGIKLGAFEKQGDQAVRDFSGFALKDVPAKGVNDNVERIPFAEVKERMTAGNTNTTPQPPPAEKGKPDSAADETTPDETGTTSRDTASDQATELTSGKRFAQSLARTARREKKDLRQETLKLSVLISLLCAAALVVLALLFHLRKRKARHNPN